VHTSGTLSSSDLLLRLGGEREAKSSKERPVVLRSFPETEADFSKKDHLAFGQVY
jgi:hypothetical protein